MQVVYSNLDNTVRAVKSPGAEAKVMEWHHVQALQADGRWQKVYGSVACSLAQACRMVDSIKN